MKRIWNFLKTINIIKTISFNVRVFPIKEALKLPVWLYGRTKIIHIHKRCVVFNCPIKPGLLRVGGGYKQLFDTLS